MRPWLVNRVTITFATIALVVLLWNLYVAQHDDGILAGTVTGPDGSPVPGAKVVLSERTIVSLDPIVHRVEYDPMRLIQEAFPAEVDAVYAKYRAAYVGQAIARLTNRVDLGR